MVEVSRGKRNKYEWIEALDLAEAIHLVAGTPSAIARGVVEIDP